MRFRRKRRKTSWIWANELTLHQLATGNPVNVTLPLLPSDVVTEECEGDCTMLRLIGDVWQKMVRQGTGGQAVGAQATGDTSGTAISILRTQEDDTGVTGQLTADPFGEPDITAASANIGGQRQFIWSKDFIYDDTLLFIQADTVSGVCYDQGLLYGSNSRRSEPLLDIKRKVHLKAGEALVWQFNFPQYPVYDEVTGGVYWDTRLTYRLLASHGRR